MATKNINILLVEDDIIFAQLILELLNSNKEIKFNTTIKKDLASAIENINQFNQDIIILDLNLPDSEGIDTLESIIKNSLEIPIIILTVITDQDLAISAVKKGAQDYLIKDEIDRLTLTRSIFYSLERNQFNIQIKEAFNRINFYRSLFTHDINNLLQVINSSISLIPYFKEQTFMDELDELVSVVKEQISRGSKLVLNVQKISQIENLENKLYLIDAIAVMNDAIEYTQKTYNAKNPVIQIHSTISSPFVQANEFLLDIFENILINAVNHNESSKIQISIKISEVIKNEKKFTKFEFLDNGIGISNEIKQQLFKYPFKKTYRKSGMGLGLLLVNKIIKLYNGEIYVEDRIKGDNTKGSNFIILIPEVD